MPEILDEVSEKTEEHEFYSDIPKGYKPGKTKFVVITGSVISGVGKGTFSSCLGSLLKLQYGLNISPIKLEGYLNYDSGTLNPFRHGEVFVLDDGTETDLDLGTYERMLNTDLTKDNFLTAGRLFKTIIDNERAGKYLGRDVQFIPHVTGELKSFLRRLAVKSSADVVLIEVGGTVGDIENSYYLEAMRELAQEEGKENVCFVNVVYVLEPPSLGEQKSKAAQLGIKSLMSLGIQPNIIVCRSENPVTKKIKEKISIASNIPTSRIIDFVDTGNIYRVPVYLEEKAVGRLVLSILGIRKGEPPKKEFDRWKSLEKSFSEAEKTIRIGITGKYTNVYDSYLSILKALEHTAPYLNAKADVKWIETTDINKDNVGERLSDVDGIIVPGGFGKRGAEGKIECIRHARENNIPYFGLCFGFQMAVIEYARNVCGLGSANTTEIDSDCQTPVICILPEQEEIEGLGGTMRLGGHDLIIKKNSIVHKLYGSEKIRERFRHRYNVSTKFIDTLEAKGMIFSGYAPQKRIMQILEVPKNDFHVGVQFHPEFTSKPLNPHPLYKGFIQACLDFK